MKQSSLLRVTGIQCPSFKDTGLNLSQAQMYISKNGDSSDLIVFPELYSSGYFMEREYLIENALELDSDFIYEIRNSARQSSCAVAMPFLEKGDGLIYNSVALIGSSGDILGVKRKSINWKSELGFIEESGVEDNLEVYDVDGFKVGVLICYEASFPELSRVLVNKGADLIIVVAFWGEWALSHWQTQLSARAIDNNVYVVGVNALMDDVTCGSSMIVSPNGNVMAIASKAAEAVSANLCKKELEVARKTVPYYQDYIAYIERIQAKLFGYDESGVGEIV